MRRFEMSETQWKSALTNIIEELDGSQYKKMLEYLTKIPRSRRTSRNKEQMPQRIIESYGEEESISVINSIMVEIPRNDSTIQNILRTFVDKERRGEKRKLGADSQSGYQKNNTASDSESSDEEPEADDAENIQSNKEIKVPGWRVPIKHLKTTGKGEYGQAIVGKVVKKSGLRSYETKKKEKKFFFNLGLADEMDSIKVMVYGRQRYDYFEEGSFYTFRKMIIDHLETQYIMKVTDETKSSKTSQVDVPKNLELEAQMLIYKQSQVYSIKQIQTLEERTCVSVEGTVTEKNPVNQVKMKKKRSKTNVLKFELKDGEDRITVTLWGDHTEQLRGTSVGDFVKVMNVKTSFYHDNVSLNSTDFTRVIKVQKAAVQNVTMGIIGILKAGKTTELEAHVSDEVETFTVSSHLLVKALELEGDLEDELLKKIPFSVEAEIQGNKINKIKKLKMI